MLADQNGMAFGEANLATARSLRETGGILGSGKESASVVAFATGSGEWAQNLITCCKGRG